MRRLKRAAQIALTRSLGLKSGERLVVVTDRFCRRIGQAFFTEGRRLGAQVILVEMPPLKEHGNEPPPIIATILKHCDIFVIPTLKSITHTKARREANLYGARGITLPGITEDIFVRTIPIDYKKLHRLTLKLAALITGARKARIISDIGTDLYLDLSHRTAHADTGLVTKPGSFSNLPAGEAYIAPISADGYLVIDGSIASIGLLRRPIKVWIEEGKMKEVEGDRGRFRRLFEGLGPAAQTVGELGVGTNQKARLVGNILEDEKAAGTVHIAFGDNLGFGGNNSAEIHIDCLIKKPTLYLDDKMIIDNGNILL